MEHYKWNTILIITSTFTGSGASTLPSKLASQAVNLSSSGEPMEHHAKDNNVVACNNKQFPKKEVTKFSNS